MKIITKYNNKSIKLNTDDLQQIGAGCESRVYKYNDIAIKVHKKSTERIKEGLSYKLVKKLKNISTERFLLPLNPIYSKEKIFPHFNGYTTKLIPNIKKKEEIIKIDSEHLYNEIKLLKEDTQILSENKILIDDLYANSNLVFNGKLYFVDPGSYTYPKYLEYNKIHNLNLENLNFTLYYYLLCLYDRNDYIAYELKNMDNINKESINTSIICLIKSIYKESFRRQFSKDKMGHINNIIKILEKYDSIQNYKYKILKDYADNSNNNSENIKIIKKIIY